MTQKIVAYLSHSYRPEDRPINMAVWRRLNAQDVVFYVDPPSSDKRPMDVTFLERMMQRSDCFVAIVPDRSRHASYGRPPHPSQAKTDEAAADAPPESNPAWSPYQELEYRLALRADKPRLIVVEKDIDPGPLPEREREHSLWFNRVSLELDPLFDPTVQKFIERAKTREQQESTLPVIGILCWNPADPPWQRLSASLKRRLGSNADFLSIDHETEDHYLLNRAHNFSILIADLNPRITPAYILGLLHGAAVPIFRTYLLEPGDTEEQKMRELGLLVDDGNALQMQPAGEIRLPSLLHRYQVDARMRPVLFWRELSIEKDVPVIVKTINDYRGREQQLVTQSNGSDYFLSLKGNRVFISTPGDLNDLTEPIKKALDEAGMPAFHYRKSHIPGGTLWKQELKRNIEEVDLLVAFISPTYWDRDECVDELVQAVARWERHQLLIVLYASAPMPPLPPFLARYQVNRVPTPDQAAEMVVGELRQRFLSSGLDEVPSAERDLQALIDQHIDVTQERDLGKLLRNTCKLSEEDADDIVARIGRSPNRSAELVNILMKGIQIERYGGGALGRLCYHMRQLERDQKKREWLSSLFSLLRLFPHLHDVHAWNRRRARREVKLSLQQNAPATEYELLTLLSGDSRAGTGMEVVQRVGKTLREHVHVEDTSGILENEHCRVYAVTGIDDPMVPIEWAVLPELNAPLARVRPVYRRIAEPVGTSRRGCIEDLLDKGLTGPPRVLIFGYGPPELPNVPKELKEIQRRFVKAYRDREWPDEVVECVESEKATRSGLEDRLRHSDYDVLHVAGHAGFEGDHPVIQVRKEGEQPGWIRGEEMGAWLRTSSVRFVYLSCCAGAIVGLGVERLAGWRQTLCREVLEAGVPEVVAYLWPVSDERSVGFTAKFYDAFLQDFDAPQALLLARQEGARSDPFWAASVLFKQPTGEDPA
jgi:CHAT domain/TIR domain